METQRSIQAIDLQDNITIKIKTSDTLSIEGHVLCGAYDHGCYSYKMVVDNLEDNVPYCELKPWDRFINANFKIDENFFLNIEHLKDLIFKEKWDKKREGRIALLLIKTGWIKRCINLNMAGTQYVQTDMNFRAGTSTNATIIGSVPAGAQVEVLGSKNGWDLITYNGVTGYICGENLGDSFTAWYCQVSCANLILDNPPVYQIPGQEAAVKVASHLS